MFFSFNQADMCTYENHCQQWFSSQIISKYALYKAIIIDQELDFPMIIVVK